MLLDLCKAGGLTTAVIVSRDGFVIESMGITDKLEMDAVGAVVSNGIVASETIGRELVTGKLGRGLLEYKNGVICVDYLGENAMIVTVADPKANLGNVRYQVKKWSATLEAAVA
jgi:predicted regulator of Ras-like GTPase activity (Roadblock/LC7/MglB family)